jgi:site-specific DNA-methyltransferase (adenine-specific)
MHLTQTADGPQVVLHRGSALTVLSALPDSSVDSVITDAPYGLGDIDIAAVLTDWLAGRDHAATGGGLMGHEWDSVVPGPATWQEVLRVLKPGGYAAVFASPRTVDLMTVSMRLAGFQILDQIVWLHGNGWPKSRDVGKQLAKTLPAGDPLVEQWSGWGSSIKPANEPIVVARKRHPASIAVNVLRHGTGAVNIDGCRIGGTGRFPANVVLAHTPWCVETGTAEIQTGSGTAPVKKRSGAGSDGNTSATFGTESRPVGDVQLTHRSPDGTETVEIWECAPGCAVAELDAQTGIMKARGNVNPTRSGGKGASDAPASQKAVIADHGAGDTGGASRFFYCAKPSQSERNAGLADSEKNPHSSVKPVELMRWLARLFTPQVTPAGGRPLVLDPFLGSGTTAVAAALEGFDCTGIDRDDDGTYLPVAGARAAHAGATVTVADTTGEHQAA